MRSQLLWTCRIGWCAGGTAAKAGPVKALTLIADRDNTLYEPDTEAFNSNGAGSFMFSGRTSSFGVRRALVRFDVAGAVPQGASVVSATLVLTVSRAFLLSNETVGAVHRVTAAWGEGGSDAGEPGGYGAEAAGGDATWEHRFFPDTSWAAEGGDFVVSPSATSVIPLSGPVEISSPGTAADVQLWLDNATENFGWIIVNDESGEQTSRRFDTRENPNEASRPRLVIEYTEDCAADFDGDGFISGVDYDLYVQAFEAGDVSADFDGDGFITGVDFDLFVQAFEAGCG